MPGSPLAAEGRLGTSSVTCSVRLLRQRPYRGIIPRASVLSLLVHSPLVNQSGPASFVPDSAVGAQQRAAAVRARVELTAKGAARRLPLLSTEQDPSRPHLPWTASRPSSRLAASPPWPLRFPGLGCPPHVAPLGCSPTSGHVWAPPVGSDLSYGHGRPPAMRHPASSAVSLKTVRSLLL